MSCSRKKAPKPPKKGRFICGACGQVRKNDEKVCKPKKIKKVGQAEELIRQLCEKRRVKRRRLMSAT